jgi:hypothetical protein
MDTMNTRNAKSPRTHTIRWLGPLIPLVLACNPVTSPHEARVLGSIAGYATGDPQIEIITGAESVIVRLTTYGDACYRQGETEVEVRGMDAEVTPYDYVRMEEGAACPAILRGFAHEAEIVFDSAGEAQIVVRGVDLVGDTLRVEHTLVLE